MVCLFAHFSVRLMVFFIFLLIYNCALLSMFIQYVFQILLKITFDSFITFVLRNFFDIYAIITLISYDFILDFIQE